MAISEIQNTVLRRAVVILYFPLSVIGLTILGALIGALENLQENWQLAKTAWRGRPISSQERREP